MLAYHPQTNGMVERSNSCEGFPGDSHGKSPTMLPNVRLVFNTAVHRSTGKQPLHLITGQHSHFPVGITNTQVDASDAAEALRGRLHAAKMIAVESSCRARNSWVI